MNLLACMFCGGVLEFWVLGSILAACGISVPGVNWLNKRRRHRHEQKCTCAKTSCKHHE